jgi:hypothetical protein
MRELFACCGARSVEAQAVQAVVPALQADIEALAIALSRFVKGSRPTELFIACAS